MKKSNYAFVSALYASKTKGLYSEMYFPIIKYSLAKIFAAKTGGGKSIVQPMRFLILLMISLESRYQLLSLQNLYAR